MDVDGFNEHEKELIDKMCPSEPSAPPAEQGTAQENLMDALIQMARQHTPPTEDCLCKSCRMKAIADKLSEFRASAVSAPPSDPEGICDVLDDVPHRKGRACHECVMGERTDVGHCDMPHHLSVPVPNRTALTQARHAKEESCVGWRVCDINFRVWPSVSAPEQDEREAFEEHAKLWGYELRRITRYADDRTEQAWQKWQSSHNGEGDGKC